MSNAIGIPLPRLSRSRAGDRQTQKYAVNGKVPGFTADFIDNYYFGHTSLSSAITHVRSGNATMTDGYGPELVVNGDFLSNIDDWSVSNGTASWVGGQLLLNETGSDGVTARAYQTITTVVGTTYWVTARVGDVSTGTGIVAASNSTSIGGKPQQNSSGNETVSFAFVAEATTTYIVLAVSGTTARTVYFDNVSVKEMPVLKWAPHNLLTYSEQFDNAAWPKTDTTITANAAIAPDGTQTADEITHTSAAPSFSRAVSPVEDGVNYTHSVFVTYIDHQWIRIGHDSASSPFGTWFDVQNGVIGTKGSNHVSSSIEDVGDGWYKLTVEGTADGTSFSTYILLADSDGGTGKVTGTSAYIWGAHLFRSDLGGMVDNPDQPLSRASYVPTTTVAKYLPRIGHHVYTGSSAWANEGLLAESEARTNEFTYDAFSGSGASITDNAGISPDGTQNAGLFTEDTATGIHRIINGTEGTDNVESCFSVYLKANGRASFLLVVFDANDTSNYFQAAFSEGFTIGSTLAVGNGTVTDSTVEEVGNGWYRVSVSGVANTAGTGGAVSAQVRLRNSSNNQSYTGDGTSGAYFYGPQFEAGSTPSSYIPNESTTTRAAESFTIPSANLPWPEPVYTGSDVITNGGFDTDSDWTKSTAPASTISGGVATVGGVGANGYIYQDASLVTGKVYEITFDVTSASATSLTFLRGNSFGNTAGSYVDLGLLTVGTHTAVFVAAYSNIGFTVGGGDTAIVSFDNVSVREINPLSVSIAMDGRITYADEGDYNTVNFYRWREDSGNFIRAQVTTNSTYEGRIIVNTQENSNADQVDSAGSDVFAPDVLVPFDIASRHGSTFLNMAQAGISYTANTTPTALPDLSATDLELAYDYMGTVGTFRVWDKDITDAGLVEATNPSLEPSLSLEFSGLGTNSFVIADWSE
jgi:hypothetical protein